MPDVGQKTAERSGTLTATYREYWAGKDRPYRNLIVDSETGEKMGQFSGLERLFVEAGVQDGDEVVIEVSKNGRRPFGERRVRLTAPHIYTLDPEEAADA